jgi:hypothetical protein
LLELPEVQKFFDSKCQGEWGDPPTIIKMLRDAGCEDPNKIKQSTEGKQL